MNSVEIKDRIDFYNNFEKAPRFYFSSYEVAVNDSIRDITKEIVDGVAGGAQRDQKLRTNLYTLVKKQTPTITTLSTLITKGGTFTENHCDWPTDYFQFLAAWPLIDGYTDYSRPLEYNNRGPVLNDTFLKPSNTQTYYNEDATGLTILRGSGGTFTSLTLEYIKKPTTFILGLESQVISAGTLITNGASYIAMEETVQNSVTYKSGTTFTAVGTALTSGKVILASNTTTTDMPEQIHDEICRRASSIMMGVTGNFNPSAFVEKQVDKNV